jgi:2-haloacid dehalogenase
MKKPKVIFFDVNETLLDLEPLKKSIITRLDNKTELGTLWFTTMLQYSLVVSVTEKYFDFGKIGAAALQMIAKSNHIKLSSDEAELAIKPILSLKPYPEVKEALKLLKSHNYKLVTLTNSSNFGINQQLKNSNLESYFDKNISIEDFGKFKPDINVYYWASKQMNINNDESLLIAAHGWDIAGALSAGWNSAFIARKGQELFPLAPLPQIINTDLLSIAKELILIK